MLKKYSFWILVICITIVSCKSSSEESSTVPEDEVVDVRLPEGFHKFYEDFHSDSIFQLEHIIFPLKGQVAIVDTMEATSVEKIYTKDGWKLHKPFVQDGSYQRNFVVLGDMVIESIGDNMGLYQVERRWAKMDSTWNLIYYGTLEKTTW